MRLLFLLSSLIWLTACGAEPAATTETDTATEIIDANKAEAFPESSPTEAAVETADSPALTAEPRPRAVAGETRADPEQAKPRPNVTLDQETKHTPPPPPPPVQELSVTEGPSDPPPPEPVVEIQDIVPQTIPDHNAWNALLSNHVSSSGQVNYRALKNNVAALDAYLSELGKYPPQGDWSRNEIMAYWINAYNAYTVKLILNNYPVNSIKDIDGGTPWATKWIEIGGKRYSLNQIENDILRARYGDARIHFAVNCAAASCPPLHNRAFTSDNLNRTLQRLTRAFVNNPSYNTLSSERIEVSKIFEWYAADFGSVKDYINGYTDTAIGADTELVYKDYDWGLNGR